jgi:hypothetical protein
MYSCNVYDRYTVGRWMMEHCENCGQETGNAGKGEDSIFIEYETIEFGPLCEECAKEVPIGEDTRPKDRIKRGLSSACVEENWDCTKKGGDV